MLANVLPAENHFGPLMRPDCGPGGILFMADPAMAWKERPAELVSTFGATTVNRLVTSTAFGFGDYGTEIVSADWKGSGEVYSHRFILILGLAISFKGTTRGRVLGRMRAHRPRKGMSNVAESIIMLPDFLETLRSTGNDESPKRFPFFVLALSTNFTPGSCLQNSKKSEANAPWRLMIFLLGTRAPSQVVWRVLAPHTNLCW